MEKYETKNRTKNVLRNMCISTVILFLGIILIFKSLKIKQGTQDILYTYNVNKDVNYTVNLVENEFFENPILDMDKTYISSLVDKINMNFTYSLHGNKKAKTKYIYQIVAVSTIKYADDKQDSEEPIWSKQYVILEPQTVDNQDSNFSIKENFDIDFVTYNTEVKKFKEQLHLPVKADLQIKLIVRSDMDVPEVEDTVIENSIMNLKMDLAEDVFTIEKQFDNTDTESIFANTESSKEVNKPLVAIGGVLVIIAIMIMLDSVRRSIKFNKKSDYGIALNRILKNYGDIVAEIVSPVEIDNLNVIDVKNFDQLLDIEEEIRMPILFYETIPDEQGEFIIVCDNIAYRYVIG